METWTAQFALPDGKSSLETNDELLIVDDHERLVGVCHLVGDRWNIHPLVWHTLAINYAFSHAVISEVSRDSKKTGSLFNFRLKITCIFCVSIPARV